MAIESSLDVEGLNLGPDLEEEGTVAFLYKHAGARALVGLEFFYRQPREIRSRRVKLDKLNRDGDSYKVTDVQAKEGLVRDMYPGELSVGLATRRNDEPIIKLFESCDVPTRPFIDSRLEAAIEREPDFLISGSECEPFGRGRGRWQREDDAS
jgi:hypothetical protein